MEILLLREWAKNSTGPATQKPARSAFQTLTQNVLVVTVTVTAVLTYRGRITKQWSVCFPVVLLRQTGTKNVVSWRRKVVVDRSSFSCVGSLFHARGAAHYGFLSSTIMRYTNLTHSLTHSRSYPTRWRVKRYDTIRDATLTCDQKPTRVSLIYHTEPTTKKWTTEKKLKSKKNGYARSEVSVNSPGNPCSQSWRRKRRLRWEGFAEKGKF